MACEGVLSPWVLMHPMELIQGGITQVESRALIELAAGSGAKRVGVWEGEELLGDRVHKALMSTKTHNCALNGTAEQRRFACCSVPSRCRPRRHR